MSGLILKLAAGEKVVINGALLENGDKPSSLRIADANARVLRCRGCAAVARVGDAAPAATRRRRGGDD